MAQEDFNKGKKVGQKVRSLLSPISLLMLIIALLGEYFIDKQFNAMIFSIVLININPAINSTKLKDNIGANVFGNISLFIGTIMLIILVLW